MVRNYNNISETAQDARTPWAAKAETNHSKRIISSSILSRARKEYISGHLRSWDLFSYMRYAWNGA
jgi:putative salt-induced outer membrane protein YdiY